MFETYGGRVPSTMQEVRAWYRKIALSVHPDKGGATEQFQVLENEYAKCKVHFKVGSTAGEEKFDRFREEFEKRMQRFVQLVRECDEINKPELARVSGNKQIFF